MLPFEAGLEAAAAAERQHCQSIEANVVSTLTSFLFLRFVNCVRSPTRTYVRTHEAFTPKPILITIWSILSMEIVLTVSAWGRETCGENVVWGGLIRPANNDFLFAKFSFYDFLLFLQLFFLLCQCVSLLVRC